MTIIQRTFIILLLSGSIVGLSKAEIDTIRIQNSHRLADLVEAYRAKTGFFPLEEFLNAGQRSARVHISPSKKATEAALKLNEPGIKEISAMRLENELQFVLGPDATLPKDPVLTDKQLRNASLYVVVPGSYFISCHLYRNRLYAKQVDNDWYTYTLTYTNPPPENTVYYPGLTEIEKRSILRVLPDRSLSLVEKGDIYFQKGNYKKAIKAYKKAASTQPLPFNQSVNLGKAYALQNKFDDGLRLFNEGLLAFTEAEQRAELYDQIGLIYSALDDIPSALQSVNQAILEDPEYMPSYINRAFYLKQMHRYKEAIADYKKYLNIAPRNIDVLLWTAALFLQIHNAKEADTYFKKAIAVGSETFNVRLAVASYYAEHHYPDEALQTLKETIALDPSLTKETLLTTSFQTLEPFPEFQSLLQALE